MLGATASSHNWMEGTSEEREVQSIILNRWLCYTFKVLDQLYRCRQYNPMFLWFKYIGTECSDTSGCELLCDNPVVADQDQDPTCVCVCV